MKLRKNVITKMDDAARIFLIGRYIKAKIFVRLAHIHLLIYALVFIFILMTLSENYNLVTHASRPVTSDSSKKHKDAKKLD